jgi:hypothetical protein
MPSIWYILSETLGHGVHSLPQCPDNFVNATYCLQVVHELLLPRSKLSLGRLDFKAEETAIGRYYDHYVR